MNQKLKTEGRNKQFTKSTEKVQYPILNNGQKN